EIAKSLTFTPAARAKADVLFANLPAATRQQYDTPERAAAFILAGLGDVVSRVRVSAVTPQGPDDVMLAVQNFYTKDDRIREHTEKYHRGADGAWQRVLPAGWVTKAAEKLSEFPK